MVGVLISFVVEEEWILGGCDEDVGIVFNSDVDVLCYGFFNYRFICINMSVDVWYLGCVRSWVCIV